MLSEQQLASLPFPVQNMFRQLETDIITRICRRISEIGALSATDIYKLNELRNIGYDMAAIQNDIAATLNKSTEEIYNIFSKAAETEYATFGKDFIPFEQNQQLQTLVQSISNATAGTFKNISKTSTVGLLTRENNVKTIKTAYQEAVDYAALQVRTGQQDFYGAIRQTIKNLSDGGARVIYESGVTRRLDTAVRQNILGARSVLSKEQAKLTGKQFGGDGYEVSYHMGFRPTHTFGGLQFSITDFEKKIFNDGKTVEELMDEPNCGHSINPIIMGVSKPAYSKEELDKLNAKNAEKHSFNGKEYNRYEATQKMRQFETAIRQQKDRANAFTAAGDKESATLARAKANAINQEYKRFSDAMGIDAQPKRASVSGYHGNYSKKLLTNIQNRDIIEAMKTDYNKSIENGYLSALVSFDDYKSAKILFDENLIGLKTSDGIKIQSYSKHFVDRYFGNIEQKRSGVEFADIYESLTNPNAQIQTRRDGSRRYNGDVCEVTLNINTGNLIQTNPR